MRDQDIEKAYKNNFHIDLIATGRLKDGEGADNHVARRLVTTIIGSHGKQSLIPNQSKRG